MQALDLSRDNKAHRARSAGVKKKKKEEKVKKKRKNDKSVQNDKR